MIPTFKAWHKIEKRILPVTCIDFAGTEVMKGHPCIVAYENDGCYPLDQIQLIKFTGKHDIAGNPIYEGHILTYENPIYPDHKPYVIKWSDEDCGFECVNDSNFMLPSVWGDMRIIGNIFENEELFEGKQ